MLDATFEQIAHGIMPLRRAAEMLVSAAQCGDLPEGSAIQALEQARAALREGEMPSARAWATIAGTLTLQPQDTPIHAQALALGGLAARGLSLLDEAEQLFEAAILHFRAGGDYGVDLANCQYSLAHLRKDQRRLDEAANLVTQAEAHFQVKGMSRDVAKCWHLLGQIRYAQGRRDEASESLQDALTTFREAALDVEAACCAYVLAHLTIDQGHLQDAVNLLMGALSCFSSTRSLCTRRMPTSRWHRFFMISAIPRRRSVYLHRRKSAMACIVSYLRCIAVAIRER